MNVSNIRFDHANNSSSTLTSRGKVDLTSDLKCIVNSDGKYKGFF